jgi:hypothetical protein
MQAKAYTLAGLTSGRHDLLANSIILQSGLAEED